MSENTAPYGADQVVSDINFTHEVFMKCEDITEFVIPELAVDIDEISERLRGYDKAETALRYPRRSSTN